MNRYNIKKKKEKKERKKKDITNAKSRQANNVKRSLVCNKY